VRKLSKIGAVVIAVFALTAIASAAQAAASTFGWASGTVKLERSANTAQVFTVTKPGGAEIGNFTCNTVAANATVGGTGAASVLTNEKTLTYNNSGSADTCPASLGTATITTHKCEYRFNAGATTGAGKSTGTVDIVNCPAAEPIEVNVSGLCLIKISNQTGISTVDYSTTATTPSTVTAVVNANKTIVTSSSGLCGTEGTVGDYTGDVTFEGTTSAGVQTAVNILP
jgi:hypothetical protein